MIGRVPRRVHALHRPAVAADDVAMAYSDVRNEVFVGTLLYLYTSIDSAAAVSSETVSPRSGCGLDGAAGGRVIAMRMCND